MSCTKWHQYFSDFCRSFSTTYGSKNQNRERINSNVEVYPQNIIDCSICQGKQFFNLVKSVHRVFRNQHCIGLYINRRCSDWQRFILWCKRLSHSVFVGGERLSTRRCCSLRSGTCHESKGGTAILGPVTLTNADWFPKFFINRLGDKFVIDFNHETCFRLSTVFDVNASQGSAATRFIHSAYYPLYCRTPFNCQPVSDSLRKKCNFCVNVVTLIILFVECSPIRSP